MGNGREDVTKRTVVWVVVSNHAAVLVTSGSAGGFRVTSTGP